MAIIDAFQRLKLILERKISAPKPLRLLNLPYLVLKECMKCYEPMDIINISMCSKRAHNHLKHFPKSNGNQLKIIFRLKKHCRTGIETTGRNEITLKMNKKEKSFIKAGNLIDHISQVIKVKKYKIKLHCGMFSEKELEDICTRIKAFIASKGLHVVDKAKSEDPKLKKPLAILNADEI